MLEIFNNYYIGTRRSDNKALLDRQMRKTHKL